VVLATCFVLPALVFVRLVGSPGSLGVAVLIVALTLPATGALILRVNPDLVPDRDTLRALPAVAWLRAAVLAGLMGAAAWILVGWLG
jgi:hypothetical protein